MYAASFWDILKFLNGFDFIHLTSKIFLFALTNLLAFYLYLLKLISLHINFFDNLAWLINMNYEQLCCMTFLHQLEPWLVHTPNYGYSFLKNVWHEVLFNHVQSSRMFLIKASNKMFSTKITLYYNRNFVHKSLTKPKQNKPKITTPWNSTLWFSKPQSNHHSSSKCNVWLSIYRLQDTPFSNYICWWRAATTAQLP